MRCNATPTSPGRSSRSPPGIRRTGRDRGRQPVGLAVVRSGTRADPSPVPGIHRREHFVQAGNRRAGQGPLQRSGTRQPPCWARAGRVEPLHTASREPRVVRSLAAMSQRHQGPPALDLLQAAQRIPPKAHRVPNGPGHRFHRLFAQSVMRPAPGRGPSRRGVGRGGEQVNTTHATPQWAGKGPSCRESQVLGFRRTPGSSARLDPPRWHRNGARLRRPGHVATPDRDAYFGGGYRPWAARHRRLLEPASDPRSRPVSLGLRESQDGYGG